MTELYVARRKERKGLYIPMGGTAENPGLVFFLPEKGVLPERQISSGQLDEMIRKQLELVGITKESDVQAVVEKAEEDYEYRVKVEEVKKEVKRLMDIRAQGGKLMRVGGKWKQAFYPTGGK